MDFNQSILERAATLKKTGLFNPMTTPVAASPPNKLPQTKPKPVRSNYEKSTPLPVPTRPKPAAIESTESCDKKPFSELSSKQTTREPENTRTNLSPVTPVTSKKPSPPTPIRNSSLKPPVDPYVDDDEAYDDIQQFQSKVMGLNEKRPSQNTPTAEPPPLPPPNTMRRSSSSDKISKGSSSPYGTYTSSTLPIKGRPSIPSTPRPSLRKPIVSEEAPSTSQLGSPAAAYKELGEPMGMGDFVNTYQKHFPLQVKFCSSHHGVITINEGDIYNVHCLKATDVVSMTATGGTQYTVPLNSAVEFGVLYNPTNNLQDAMQGFLFSTAGEIISTGLVPPIICAQQSCEVSSQDGSVMAGDVLVIQEVKQKLLRGKMLMCTDVRTEQKIRLSDNCCGNFSTTPSHVKLFLPQLLRHIPLPQYCVLFYNGKNAQEVNSKLPRGTVEVTRITTQQSILVSRHGHSSNELFEFPLSNNIVVQAIRPSENVMQQLIEDTKKKCEAFNPLNVNNTTMMLSVENPYSLSKQVTLLSTTRQDENAFIGVKLVSVGNLASPRSDLLSTANQLNPTEVEDDDEDYQIPGVARAEYEEHVASKKFLPDKSHYDSPTSNAPAIKSNAPTKPNVPNIIKKPNNEDDDVYDIPNVPIPKKVEIGASKMRPPITSLPSSTSDKTDSTTLQKEVDCLKKETHSLKAAVEKLEIICKGLSTSVANLQTELKSVKRAAASNSSKDSVPDTPEANISYLRSLSCEQIQQLITELNLSEYSAIFFKEQIDGSLLIECDDDLMKDLGISSKLHRMRLSNFITGRASARQLLEKDPYVKCFKQK